MFNRKEAGVLFRRAFSSVATIDCVTVADKLAQGEKCVVLDVREADEYEAGHIPGSVWIPLDELPGRIEELPTDQEIFAVCHSGGRSAVATRLLNNHGYNTKNMIGGMVDWAGAVTR